MNTYIVFDRATGKTIDRVSANDYTTAINCVAQFRRMDKNELRCAVVGCSDDDYKLIKTIGDALKLGYNIVRNMPTRNGIVLVNVPIEKLNIPVSGRWQYRGVFENELFFNDFYNNGDSDSRRVFAWKSEILK